MRPKRTDDKYWTGTRNFNHIQYESDLEDYIIDLENETQQLRKHAVVERSEQLCDLDGKTVLVKFKLTKHIPKIVIEDI